MMVIPNTVFEENGITFSTVSLYSFAFKDGTFFHNTHSTKTASGILSATLSNIKLENLKTPIDISFKRKGKEGAEKQTVVCGFWQKNTGQWATDGVQTIGSFHDNSRSSDDDDDIVMCHTMHLTNFALLLDVSQNAGNPEALQMVTWIGCTISLVGLTMTVFSILVNRKLRKKLAQRLLLCFCLSLICTVVIFLTGVENAETSIFNCRIVAGLLHYFMLKTFFWMAVHALHLYQAFVKVFQVNTSNPERFLFRAFMFCTVTPAVIVLLSVLLNQGKDYGNEKLCIVQGTVFYVALLLPISLVLLINIITLVVVIRSVTKPCWNASSSANSRYTTTNKDTFATHYKNLKIALAFSVLLGTTWLFGVLAVGSLTEVFQYLFCIFNSLQGFFIFVFYTLLNRDFLKFLKIQ